MSSVLLSVGNVFYITKLSLRVRGVLLSRFLSVSESLGVVVFEAV